MSTLWEIIVLIGQLVMLIGLIPAYFLASGAGIYLFLRFMELVERMWGGDTFLGFCAYVPPEDRWTVDHLGREVDREQEAMERIRPSIKRARIIQEVMES